MPLINPSTDTGKKSASQSVTIKSGILGGYKLNGDGTNTATLVITDVDASGRVLVDTSTIQGEKVTEPMRCSGTVYCTLGGTGGTYMIYDWDLVKS